MPGSRAWERARARIARWASRALVGLVFALVGLSLLSYVTVEHTSQPEYCASCHIMEPYYASWESSSHRDVSCIECHFEPGAIETFRGKFQALSQLAKYVTRTQGTKPWAEVSDASCMRSGCHSVRTLEGPIAFGRVKFDHRHHLLESRRGKRLRCVSCHSQIVQGEHVTVTDSVCFMCHFMPLAEAPATRELDDCMTCHGPPEEPIEVAGRPFDHEEYIERGVACRECHDPVVEGDGQVRKERCHSCHAEIGHIERYGEIAFLHQEHVTDHKVECFECHDEIRHGLLPLGAPHVAEEQGCGACHRSPHESTSLLYAGTGALGVADDPSRMYETRVVCQACHTGRSGGASHGADRGEPTGHGHGYASPSVAAAGEVDCIHCHGTGFESMLGDWQAAVGGQLTRLDPLLDRLRNALSESTDAELRRLYDEARLNIELVEMDGSRGAHNVLYALDALEVGAQRLDEAFARLDPSGQGLPVEAAAASGFPFRSEHGCSVCHMGAERLEVQTTEGRPFPHGRHLREAGLDCDACHSVAQHGEPTFARSQCASCHHQESEERDVWDCAACHSSQRDFVAGSPAGFEPQAGPMAEKDCTECHGEPPALVIPKPAMCALCHDQSYAEAQGTWQEKTDELIEELTEALASAAAGGVVPRAIEQSTRSLEAVRRDGSRGVHNFDLAKSLLEDALRRLQGD